MIRDRERDRVTAGAGKLKYVRDAFRAEVHARITWLKAAIEKGVDKIILETDSLIMKQALENDPHRLAEAGGIAEEFNSFEFQ